MQDLLQARRGSQEEDTPSPAAAAAAATDGSGNTEVVYDKYKRELQVGSKVQVVIKPGRGHELVAAEAVVADLNVNGQATWCGEQVRVATGHLIQLACC